MNFSVSVIRKIKDKWYVYSKKGKKLAGPFDTKKEAVKRLQEIETFKNQKGKINLENKIRLFSIASNIIDPKDKSKLNESLVKAKKIEKPNEDLLYLEFVLCHEGANGNKDGFLLSELQENFETAVYKDLNVEHSDKIIGCIYNSILVEEEANARYTFAGGFKPHIVCSAVVYQFKFPEEAQEIRDRHKQKNLTFSMETWFKEAQCSVCENKYELASNYCDHLNNRFTQGNDAIRYLRGITFGGAAVVKNPADKDAVGLTVAQEMYNKKQLVGVHEICDFDVKWIADLVGESLENFEKVFEAWIENLQENELINMGTVVTRVKEIVNNILNDDSSKANLSKGGQKPVEYKFESKEDLMNSDIVGEILTDKIKEGVTEALEKQDKDGKIKELNDEKTSLKEQLDQTNEKMEALQKEHDNFKEKVEKEKKDRELDEVVESRFKELTEAGVKYTEDRQESVKSRLRSMSDEDYNDYKEDMISNLPKKDNKITKQTQANKIPTIPSNFSSASEDEDFEYLDNLNVALAFKEPVFDNKELQN